MRLMPPSYVKPYVKRQKNDAADAEAICEAVTRPTMRFVEVKTPGAAERDDVAPGSADAHPPAHADIERDPRAIWPSSGSWRRSGGTGSSNCLSSFDDENDDEDTG